MAGNWTQIPTECSQSYTTETLQCTQWGSHGIYVCNQWADHGSYACAQWADHGSNQCSSWADEGSNQCSSWADEGHNNCCDWAPCSWFCDAFYWVANWVCQGWYWVANLVCQAWYWVANLVCQAWYWVARIVCVLFYVIFQFFCVLWTWVTHWFCLSNFNGGTMLLLTDGTVILNECSGGYGTRHWWKLTPDNTGSYINGTWSRIQDSNYGRKYFASAVFADGRVIVCGGEYSDVSGSNTQDDTNKCEIYDPVANTWTEIAAPANWTQIGDSVCSMLPNGKFLLGNFNSTVTAIFDPSNAATPWSAAANKNDSGSEESWVLLPDNTIIAPQCVAHPGSEKYDIANNTWIIDNPVTVDLVEASSIEIGPGILLPDGRAFFAGATSNTALYTMPAINTNAGTWNTGPAIPPVNSQNLGSKDGAGCLMVNGNVLIPFAPVDGVQGNYNSPCYFFEFDGTNLNRVTDPPSSNCPTYVGRMMLLPTGEILFAREDSSDIYAYSYKDQPQNSWKPVITSCPQQIFSNTTIQVSGTQFNGLSHAVGYGDDAAAATNYPLVRIKNTATGHVRYCRTFNHTITIGNTITTSMGVATGNAIVTTNVAIPADIETGECELFVVANGIASDAYRINIQSSRKG